MKTFSNIEAELDAYLEDDFLYSEASLAEFKVFELKDILSSNNLPIYGTKKVLIKRLVKFYNDERPLAVESTINIKKEVKDDEQFQEEEEVKPATGFKV